MLYLSDALVILGLFALTVGVYGVIRMPDTYLKLHAASKAVFLGVIPLLVASAATGDPAIIYTAVSTKVDPLSRKRLSERIAKAPNPLCTIGDQYLRTPL